MTREVRRRLKRKGLDARQIKVYAHLHSHCFNGPQCWPSQKLIAQRCGISRQLVNAVCQELRDHGVLTWEHQRIRGSEHPCNVYTLRYWTRPKRSGTLRVLKRLNACSHGLPDTKGQERRAPTPSRAQRRTDNRSGKAHPSLGAGRLKNHKRWSGDHSAGQARETRCALCEFEIRRSQVPQPRQRRLSAVPDLLCESCRRYAEEVEAKAEIIQKLARENSELADKYLGAVEATTATGKENATLKRRITRAANEDAEAEAIEAICEDWRRDHPRASIAPGGRRWEVAKRALRLMKDDEQGAKHACLEALEGLRLRPYQQFDRRYATPGEGRVRRDDIEHALGDEVRIERCRAYARWAGLTTPEQWWVFYEAASAVAELYWRRAVDAIGGGDGLEGERS